MAEYYKIPAHSLPHQAAGTTEADREAADRDLWERVAGLEKSPVLPALPTAAGSYELKLVVSGSSKTYSWVKDGYPALPTTAGDYKLTVTVDGSTKTYSWAAIEAAAE